MAALLAVSPAVRPAVIDPGPVFVFAEPASPDQRAAMAAVRSQFARVVSGPDLASLPLGSKPAACIALGPAALQTAVDQRVQAPLLCVLASQQSFRRATAAGPTSLRATAIYAEPSPSHQMRLIAALYKRTVVVGVLLSEQSTAMGALLLQAAAEQRLELLVAYADPSLPLSRNLLRLASATVLLIFPDSALYTQASLRELLETTYRRRQPVIGFSERLVAAGTLASAYSSVDDTLRQLQPMVSSAVIGRLPPAQFPRYWQVAVNDSVARSMDVIVDDEVRRLGERP